MMKITGFKWNQRQWESAEIRVQRECKEACHRRIIAGWSLDLVVDVIGGIPRVSDCGRTRTFTLTTAERERWSWGGNVRPAYVSVLAGAFVVIVRVNSQNRSGRTNLPQ